MDKVHWVTIISVIMALVSFGFGSVPGGLVFMGLALWVEINSAWKLSRKYRAPARKPGSGAKDNE